VPIEGIPDGHVEINKMGTDRTDTYGAAYDYCIDVLGGEVLKKDLQEFMQKKDLTWHECGDRRTIRLVPTEINQVFAHTGGIGIEKDFETLQSELKDIATDDEGVLHELSLQKIPRAGKTNGLSEAIEWEHEKNKTCKKELF
jgi:hypothetical protein